MEKILSLISVKVEFIFQNLPTKTSRDQDDFTGKF